MRRAMSAHRSTPNASRSRPGSQSTPRSRPNVPPNSYGAQKRSDIINRPGVVAHIAGIPNPPSARMAILPRGASNNTNRQTKLLKKYLSSVRNRNESKMSKKNPPKAPRSQALNSDHGFTIVNRSKKRQNKKGVVALGSNDSFILPMLQSVAPVESDTQLAFKQGIGPLAKNYKRKKLVRLHDDLRVKTSCQKSLLSSFAFPTKNMRLYLGCIATPYELTEIKRGEPFSVDGERITFTTMGRTHLQGASINRGTAIQFTKKALAEYKTKENERVYKVIFEIIIRPRDNIYLFDVNHKGPENLTAQSLACLRTMSVKDESKKKLVNSESSVLKRVMVAKDKWKLRNQNGSLKFLNGKMKVTPETVVHWSKTQGENILYAPIFSNPTSNFKRDDAGIVNITVNVRSSTAPINEAVSHIRNQTQKRRTERATRKPNAPEKVKLNPWLVSNSNSLDLQLLYAGFPRDRSYSVGLSPMAWEARKQAKNVKSLPKKYIYAKKIQSVFRDYQNRKRTKAKEARSVRNVRNVPILSKVDNQVARATNSGKPSANDPQKSTQQLKRARQRAKKAEEKKQIKNKTKIL